MLIISKEQVEKHLDMESCITLMKQALMALSTGDAKQIVRPVLPMDKANLLGMMPAYIASHEIAGVKVLSVFPENYKLGIPSHQGQLILFETKTGSLKAIIDAEAITAIRTAAVSAAVTDILANRTSNSLAILGAGLQGRQHAQAIAMVRIIKDIYVWDLRKEASQEFAAEISKELGISVHPCDTVSEATKNAQIICTLTPSKTPILTRNDVAPGTHINAVGACTPSSRELTGELVSATKLYIDNMAAILAESGDYLLALKEGAISEGHIIGEIGSVFAGTVKGRTSHEDITLFKALGQAAEDVIAGNFVADKLISK